MPRRTEPRHGSKYTPDKAFPRGPSRRHRRATGPEGAGGALLPSRPCACPTSHSICLPSWSRSTRRPGAATAACWSWTEPRAAVSHQTFPDLVEYLTPADVVVLNDTRVIRGRCFAAKPTGGRVEILVERILAPDRVLAWLRAGKTPGCGVHLSVDHDH